MSFSEEDLGLRLNDHGEDSDGFEEEQEEEEDEEGDEYNSRRAIGPRLSNEARQVCAIPRRDQILLQR